VAIRISSMRTACVFVALLGLSACAEDDQRYLLTYEHPKAANPVVTTSATPQPVRDTASVSPIEARLTPVPMPPVAVVPETTVGAPLAAENSTPDPGTISAAEIPPPSGTPAAPPVGPPQIVPAQPAPSPALETTPALGSNQSIVPAQSSSVAPAVNLAPPTAVPSPRVVVLKPPFAARPVPSPASSEARRAVPAMVRPAPPPVETAAAPSPPPAPAQTTTAVAISTAAGTSAAATTAPAAAPQPTHSEHDAARCKAVADQRALDALSNGYDSEMERQIFAGTYRNCMSWAAEHR
jgi:hypothetical protein